MSIKDEQVRKKIVDTLPGTLGGVLKRKIGKGPERLKLGFFEDGVVIHIGGFITYGFNDTSPLKNDPLVTDAIREYYYRLTKAHEHVVKEFFLNQYDVDVTGIFCDFEVQSNEALIVVRC